MSYSYAPNPDDSLRARESAYWNSQAQPQNGNGISKRIGNFFEDKADLPMYKDKPYSYAASSRLRPLWKRRPVQGLAITFVFSILYYFGLFSATTPQADIAGRKWGLASLKGSAVTPADWNRRRDSVREAFKMSWDGYEKYAWGKDEYYPISKNGRQMTPSGMGWIIVDALDTLMIMNLTSRLSHAREWISTSLNYTQDHDVNTFETTIRMLGGLLSAHYLSTEFPYMAPLDEDDVGKPGEDLYIEKATDLADRLVGAFESHSGIPYASINLASRKGIPSHADGGASSTAEASSLQLEFKYLAMLLGETMYWETAENVMKVIDDNGMEDGLLPIYIHPDSGKFMGSNIRLGSRGDSYYEYLIKQYLQTEKEEPVYLELWDQALAGVRKHLITYSENAHFTVLAERPSGLKSNLSPKMDHLVCFMPGTIALAATEGRLLSDARKSPGWSHKQEEEIELARELTKTCWGMYKATLTGLAPEIAYFNVDDPPHMESDGRLTSKQVDWNEQTEEPKLNWKTDYVIKPMDSHNLQRPETVESLFYMWRITGDNIYREWGWEMFSSFVKFTALEDGGFTSLSNANTLPPETRDNMESFWLAETLKYFYLLFSPVDLLPLDKVVINTEAHFFPRFKLQRGLKTGWQRKPRDEMGKIIRDFPVHSESESHQKKPDEAPAKKGAEATPEKAKKSDDDGKTQEKHNEKDQGAPSNP